MNPFTFSAPRDGKRRASIFGVTLATVALVFGACQTVTSPTPEGPTPTATATTVEGTPPTDEFGLVTVPPGEPIHIVFWGVLSGGPAFLGEDVKQGIEIALDDKGGKLLGRDIRFTTEDALCSPEGGTSAATKVAADTTVAGVIGAVCTDEVRGGIQTITEAGLTTISASASRANLTAPDRGPEFAGFLRTAQSDLLQGNMVAEYMYNQLGKRTLATIHDGSGYAQGIVEVAAARFTALGGTVTKQEAVSVGQTDMSTVLTSVAADNPDVLYYPIFMPEGGFLTTQAKTTPGLEDTILFSSDGLFTPSFISAVGEDALNMYLSSPDTTKFAAGYQDLLTKRAAKYGGTTLGPYHAHAYDATNMVLAAIEKVAVTGADGTIYIGRKALRDAIYATQGFRGLTGVLTCGQYGDCGSPILAVYQVTAREVGGEWPPATVFEQPTS